VTVAAWRTAHHRVRKSRPPLCGWADFSQRPLRSLPCWGSLPVLTPWPFRDCTQDGGGKSRSGSSSIQDHSSRLLHLRFERGPALDDLSPLRGVAVGITRGVEPIDLSRSSRVRRKTTSNRSSMSSWFTAIPQMKIGATSAFEMMCSNAARVHTQW